MTAIRVELQLADGSFTSGMLRAGQTLAQFNAQLVRAHPQLATFAKNGQNIVKTMKSAEVATGGMLSTIRDLSVVAGAVSIGLARLTQVTNGWVGEVVRVNAEMERLRYMMTAMSTASDPFKDAASNVKYLREQAAMMPFSLKTITDTFAKLKATGVDPMNGSMKALADGIAAFGGTDESLHRVTIAVTQMTGKSVIQMEELRQQLGEHMPAAIQVMARSMGVSVAELTKTISTGTVTSTEALEKFYDELNRTYGGSARRLMQSFSGQMAQLRTNLQNLAIGEGGAGFFGQIKKELIELNDFVKSDFAARLAIDLGQAFEKVVAYVKEAVSFLWRFRNELTMLAEIAAAGYGLAKLNEALQASIGFFQAAGLQATVFGSQLKDTASYFALATSGTYKWNTAITRGQYLGIGFGKAIANILGGLLTFGPHIALAVGAVYLLASAFGLLSNKVEEAYESLKKYGAQNRKDAQDATDNYIKLLQSRIETMKRVKKELEDKQKGFAAYDDMAGFGGAVAPTFTTKSLERNIAEAQKKLVDAQKDGPRLIREAQKRGDDAALKDLDANLDEQIMVRQRAYDRDAQALSKKNVDEIKNAEKTGATTLQIRKKYEGQIIGLREKFAEDNIKIYNDEITRIEGLMDGASVDQQRQYGLWIGELQRKLIKEQDELRRASEFRSGISTQPKIEPDEKKVERGAKRLETLKQGLEGLRSEFLGASDAVGEMQAKIAAGDYGNITDATEGVKKMHDEIVKTTAAMELLDRLNKSQKKAQSDLDAVKRKTLDDRMDLLMRKAGMEGATEAEKMKFRIQNGYYEGLGDYDKVREAITTIIKTMNVQGLTANNVGIAMRQNAFGNETVSHIFSVRDALGQVASELNKIGIGINGADFSRLGSGLPSQKFAQFSGSILDLIAKVESGGDYNATLDNGKWTGGARNLTGMTLNEVRDLQRMMLANPENREKYRDENGNAVGSSALGRYQIVGKTLESLMKEMGLSGNELYDSDMQDRMAIALLNRRRGQGVGGLRNEWAGLKGVPDEAILKALGAANTGPTKERAGGFQAWDAATQFQQSIKPEAQIPKFDNVETERMINQLTEERVKQTEKLVAELDKQIEAQQKNAKDSKDQDRIDELKKYRSELANTTLDLDNLGKHFRALKDKVSAGKFGQSRDINADEYKELVAAAKELDSKETEIRDKRKSGKQYEEDVKKFKENQVLLNERLAEQQKRVNNPDYKPDSREVTSLMKQYDAMIEHARVAYGEDTDEYKKAIADKANALKQLRLVEATGEHASNQKSLRGIQDLFLNQTQLRQVQMERQLAELDRIKEKLLANGGDEVAITQQIEAQKAAIRRKYAEESSPITKQMREWGDLQENLSKASTKWMDSLAGGVTDLIMGTGNLKQVVQGMLKDVVNMGVKYMMSNLFQGVKGGAGGKLGGAKAGGAKASAPLNIAKGGKKFDTGGWTGPGSKEQVRGFVHADEYVFPKEVVRRLGLQNLVAMHHNALQGYANGGLVGNVNAKPAMPFPARDVVGSNDNFTIHAPITVNGSAGTPEQNTDLANKMAKQMELTMRGVVADEVRKQSRAGGFLNTRTRN